MSKECIECGKPATEEHHVIPRSLGGTFTVPLCGSCHDRVHGWGNTRRDNHVELTKAGQARAKERGVKIGRANEKWSGDTKAMAEKSTKIVKEKADKFATKHICAFLEMKIDGATLVDIAQVMNFKEIPTSRGDGTWHAGSVANVFKRFDIPRWHPGWPYEEKLMELISQKSEEEMQEHLDLLSKLT